MSNVATTYWQAGIESEGGTAVAATRKLYAKAGVPSEGRPKEHIQQSRNTWDEYYDAVETHAHVPSILFEHPAANFNTLPWWLKLAAKGGVSPTGSGPYIATYNSAGTTLDPATLEVRDETGSFQIPFAMCKSWEIAGKGGSGPSPVTAKFEFIGQKLTAGHTMTTGLSELDLRGHYMAFKNTKIYMDAAVGDIGDTEVAASLEEFSIKCDNKLDPRFTGGNSGYYSKVNREHRHVVITATLLFNAAMYAQYSAQFQANAGRFIQLKNAGTVNDLFTFNIYSKIETFEFPEDKGTRRVAIMGRSIYDPTLGYSWQAAVQNDVATIA